MVVLPPRPRRRKDARRVVRGQVYAFPRPRATPARGRRPDGLAGAGRPRSRAVDSTKPDGGVDELHRYAPLARAAASRRRGDGRSSLRSANGTRPAAIQHSALSIQHYPSPASRHPIRRPHAIIFRPFALLPNSSTMQTRPRSKKKCHLFDSSVDYKSSMAKPNKIATIVYFATIGSERFLS